MSSSATEPDNSQPMLEGVEVPDIGDVVTEPPGAAASFVRTAFGHSAIYLLGGVLSQAMGIILFPFFARVLSPQDYGIIDLVGLAATLVGVTVGLEVASGLGRYFVEADNLEDRRTLASTALIFTVGTYTVVAVAAFALIKPLTQLLFGPGVDTSVMAVAIVGLWCGGILYLGQYLLQFQLRPAAFGAVSVVTFAVGTGTSAILVLGFRIGVLGALIGQPVGSAAGSAIAFAFSRSLFRFRFDLQRLRRMLAYSVPLAIGSIGVFLNAYADRLAIRTRLSVADVGVYGAGYRLGLIVSLILLGLQGALSPLVLSRHAEPGTRRELARLFRMFCGVALTVLLLVSLFASELLHILTRPEFYGGAVVVPFVIAGSFLAGIEVFAPGLSIAKRTRLYGAVVGLTGLVNLILAFALVGPLGIRGPAIAFLLACGGGFATLMVLSQRVYRVPHDWRRLVPRAVAVGAIVAVAYVFLGQTVSVEYLLVRLAFSAIGLAIIAGLLDRAEVGELVRSLLVTAQTLRRALQTVLQRQHATPV